jgi:hypothetical protein
LPQLDISLKVNNRRIDLNPFAGAFISSTLLGMLSNLRGMEAMDGVESIQLDICGRDVAVKANGEELSMNQFVADFIGNTTRGMVSPLRGVDKNVEVIGLSLLYPLTNPP